MNTRPLLVAAALALTGASAIAQQDMGRGGYSTDRGGYPMDRGSSGSMNDSSSMRGQEPQQESRMQRWADRLGLRDHSESPSTTIEERETVQPMSDPSLTREEVQRAAARRAPTSP